MSKINTAMGKYKTYMTEIRYRIAVIDRALGNLQGGGALTGFRESDIELIYLQFRHCLELIMFASLSAHHSHGYELSQRLLNKEHSATKLLRFIKTINPKFYPSPVEPKDIKRPDMIDEIAPITEEYLTQDDFCKLYDRTCGKMLHAQRASKFQDGHDKLIEDAVYYRDRLRRLLNCHWVHLTEGSAFRVIMHDAKSKTGEVGMNHMEVVKDIPKSSKSPRKKKLKKK